MNQGNAIKILRKPYAHYDEETWIDDGYAIKKENHCSIIKEEKQTEILEILEIKKVVFQPLSLDEHAIIEKNSSMSIELTKNKRVERKISK
ncbi:hypothetical protein FZC35_00855 [Candidatus Cytomitobacter indipagum]|uniref:Uncharacterized protein n=1 Tax=Candidatus Cytomitobacter indipagum TaxID=2601575 RepID=A0A5C0UF93_9PROT|nr:hypothetical protein [Candidatus Cytomitobacter indipagum]QEK37932.1 hypothetical protein FZC35_00855 [Candidatus Cytomitobacter indipagum]